MLTAGTCLINVTKAGDADYLDRSTSFTVNIAKANQATLIVRTAGDLNYNPTTPGNLVIPLSGDASWSSSTFKLGYEKDLSPTQMFYATVSTGFNDMHFFSHHLQIPTLGYGPGGIHCHAFGRRQSVSDQAGNGVDARSPHFHSTVAGVAEDDVAG